MVDILKNKTRLELYYEIEENMEENKKIRKEEFNYPRISGKSIDIGFAEFFSFFRDNNGDILNIKDFLDK